MDKIKEVIVVEGRDDTQRIQLAVQADTIETNGSAINEATLDLIRHAQAKRGVIVFTDPDFPGEKIRKIISRHVPGVKHAFLTQDEARPKAKGSLGIEHASKEAIIKALSQVYTLGQVETKGQPVTKSFLLKNGLIGGEESAYLRKALGEKLRIGYTNGKQLVKRLNAFQISQETVSRALQEICQSGKDDHND